MVAQMGKTFISPKYNYNECSEVIRENQMYTTLCIFIILVVGLKVILYLNKYAIHEWNSGTQIRVIAAVVTLIFILNIKVKG